MERGPRPPQSALRSPRPLRRRDAARALLARRAHRPRRAHARAQQRGRPEALVCGAEVARVIAMLLLAVLDLASYRARLEQIDALLARGQNARAAAEARTLLAQTVRAQGEDLSPDAWALSPVARGEAHRARLRGLLESLATREAVTSP